MGMSTSIVGIMPADEKFLKMKAIWELCEETGVDIPDEVDDFFEGEPPSDKGVKVYLGGHDSVSEFRNDYSDGFDVEIAKLPKNIKFIRFYNSW